MWGHQVLSFFIFKIFRQKRSANAFEMPTMSAICLLLILLYNFITIFGLLGDLDLQYFGAFVTDPTPALKSLTCLQTVENDIELLTY